MFPLNSSNRLSIVENGRYYFFGLQARPLRPGEENTEAFFYNVTGITKNLEKIEIEPFIIEQEKLDPILCEEVIITQEVNCV